MQVRLTSEVWKSGKKIRAGALISLDDDTAKSLIRSGHAARPSSEEEQSFLMRQSVTSVKPKTPGSPSVDMKVAMKFDLPNEALKGKSLLELNAMILERDPQVTPFEDIKEARAFLQQDTK